MECYSKRIGDVQTKPVDRMTNEREETSVSGQVPTLAKLYLSPDKPFFPGDQFCHVLQEPQLYLRLPAAQGEGSA
jgi:hypothetical protein